MDNQAFPRGCVILSPPKSPSIFVGHFGINQSTDGCQCIPGHELELPKSVILESVHVVSGGLSPPGLPLRGITSPTIEDRPFTVRMLARSNGEIEPIFTSKVYGGQWITIPFPFNSMVVDMVAFDGDYEALSVVIHAFSTGRVNASTSQGINESLPEALKVVQNIDKLVQNKIESKSTPEPVVVVHAEVNHKSDCRAPSYASVKKEVRTNVENKRLARMAAGKAMKGKAESPTVIKEAKTVYSKEELMRFRAPTAASNPFGTLYETSSSAAVSDDLMGGGFLFPSSNGAVHNRFHYTAHALERMAPDTPEMVKLLFSRACKDLVTKFSADKCDVTRIGWWEKFLIKPRGILPGEVEKAIIHPSSTLTVKGDLEGNIATAYWNGIYRFQLWSPEVNAANEEIKKRAIELGGRGFEHPRADIPWKIRNEAKRAKIRRDKPLELCDKAGNWDKQHEAKKRENSKRKVDIAALKASRKGLQAQHYHLQKRDTKGQPCVQSRHRLTSSESSDAHTQSDDSHSDDSDSNNSRNDFLRDVSSVDNDSVDSEEPCFDVTQEVEDWENFEINFS